VGGDLGVDEQRNLRHRYAQQRRRHLAQHLAHAGVAPGAGDGRRRQADARQAAHGNQRRHLHRQLQQAAQHHTTGQGQDGLQAPWPPGAARPTRRRR
jgi:hypothetical protein